MSLEKKFGLENQDYQEWLQSEVSSKIMTELKQSHNIITDKQELYVKWIPMYGQEKRVDGGWKAVVACDDFVEFIVLQLDLARPSTW